MIQNERLSQGGGGRRDAGRAETSTTGCRPPSHFKLFSQKDKSSLVSFHQNPCFVFPHTERLLCVFPRLLESAHSSLEEAGGNAPQATGNRVIRRACRRFVACRRSEMKACFTVAYITDEQARDNGDRGLRNRRRVRMC